MNEHEQWMARCLSLARLGAASAAPNPLVGAVLVQQGRLRAEGWHREPGMPHAEAECLRAFGDGPVPPDATLYVNLEPCDHQGRTPPCSLLIIARQIRHVVIAHRDPFPAVDGGGIARLRAAGVEVTEGVRAAEAEWMNRRFLTSIRKGRPYIILKWAQSTDGFLDRHPRNGRGVQRISAPATDTLVHRWRSEEQAIMAGSRTVLNDDPRLDVRHAEGRSPLRVIIDRDGLTPASSHVYDGTRPTLLFTLAARPGLAAEQCILDRSDDPLEHVLNEVHRRGIRSILVEGGARLHGAFLTQGLWDEARVVTGGAAFGVGTPAPTLPVAPVRTQQATGDRIDLFVNAAQQPLPDPAWPW